MGRRGVRFMEEESEWRLPSVLYADDRVLCVESKEEFRVMVEYLLRFVREEDIKSMQVRTW